MDLTGGDRRRLAAPMATPPLPAAYWIAALLHAVVLCVLPAAAEFRSAWQARGRPATR